MAGSLFHVNKLGLHTGFQKTRFSVRQELRGRKQYLSCRQCLYFRNQVGRRQFLCFPCRHQQIIFHGIRNPVHTIPITGTCRSALQKAFRQLREICQIPLFRQIQIHRLHKGIAVQQIRRIPRFHFRKQLFLNLFCPVFPHIIPMYLHKIPVVLPVEQIGIMLQSRHIPGDIIRYRDNFPGCQLRLRHLQKQHETEHSFTVIQNHMSIYSSFIPYIHIRRSDTGQTTVPPADHQICGILQVIRFDCRKFPVCIRFHSVYTIKGFDIKIIRSVTVVLSYNLHLMRRHIEWRIPGDLSGGRMDPGYLPVHIVPVQHPVLSPLQCMHLDAQGVGNLYLHLQIQYGHVHRLVRFLQHSYAMIGSGNFCYACHIRKRRGIHLPVRCNMNQFPQGIGDTCMGVIPKHHASVRQPAVIGRFPVIPGIFRRLGSFRQIPLPVIFQQEKAARLNSVFRQYKDSLLTGIPGDHLIGFRIDYKWDSLIHMIQYNRRSRSFPLLLRCPENLSHLFRQRVFTGDRTKHGQAQDDGKNPFFHTFCSIHIAFYT